MNVRQFMAILLLRWRIWWNQIWKGGALQAILLSIIAGFGVLFGGFLFFLAFLMGMGMSEFKPIHLMGVWDAIVVVFLFVWIAGLATELQRAESLSLAKIMHMPVSLTGAFVVNYLTSLIGVRLAIMVPAMAGLCLGLTYSRGPAMLMLIPLVAGFLLMVTAITYQFQGWLASLMVNKRRRRLIVVLVTATFILIGQLPNILGNYFRGNIGEDVSQLHQEAEPTANGKVATKEQQLEGQKEIQRKIDAFARDPFHLNRLAPTIQLANTVLPPGWLPLGATGLVEGNMLPALFGTLGMSLLGAISLWRSYQTTVNLYKGRFTSGKRPAVMLQPNIKPGPATSVSSPTDSPTAVSRLIGLSKLLENKLPGLPEQASAIALAGFRSLSRDPQAFMLMLTPVIMTLLFGGAILRNRSSMAETLRLLSAFGAMVVVLVAHQPIMGNQFGFDRNGFRVFVLSPARRRDILLGKNLTMAPLILGLGAIMALMIQVLIPMRIDHFLAVFPLQLSMYLVFCLLANCSSIQVPCRLAAGVFRRADWRGITVLYNLAFSISFLLIQVPMMLPYGIEMLLEDLAGIKGVPVCLGLSLLELTGVIYLYRVLLEFEGRWLQAREKKILEIVAPKAE